MWEDIGGAVTVHYPLWPRMRFLPASQLKWASPSSARLGWRAGVSKCGSCWPGWTHVSMPLPTYSPSHHNTRAALEHGRASSRLCQSVEGGAA